MFKPCPPPSALLTRSASGAKSVRLLPAGAPFSKEFGRFYCDVRQDPRVDPFRSARHYERVGDLRLFGYELILHLDCLWGKRGNHKVELPDSGAMSYAGMRNEIERVFDLDARRLALMRVDLAADVRGVSVEWFMRHVRARYKQWVCDIGEVDSEIRGYARTGSERGCASAPRELWHHGREAVFAPPRVGRSSTGSMRC